MRLKVTDAEENVEMNLLLVGKNTEKKTSAWCKIKQEALGRSLSVMVCCCD